MKVSATQLANETKAILDRVVQRRDPAKIQRHGKTVAEIRRKLGIDREDLLAKATRVQLTKTEAEELNQAIDAVSDVVEYAGAD